MIMMDQHALNIDDQKRESWKDTAFAVCCCIGMIGSCCTLIGLAIWGLCQSPKFPDISITSLHVSAADANDNNNNNTWTHSGGGAAGDIEFSMALKNRGDEIKYSDIRASMYYQGSLLASTTLFPFQQDAHDVTEKNVSMRAMINMDQILTRAKLANNTDDDNLVFAFDVSVVSSRAQVSTPTDSELYAEINVLCSGVRVQFTNLTMADGYMTAGPHNCDLQVHYLPAPDKIL